MKKSNLISVGLVSVALSLGANAMHTKLLGKELKQEKQIAPEPAQKSKCEAPVQECKQEKTPEPAQKSKCEAPAQECKQEKTPEPAQKSKCEAPAQECKQEKTPEPAQKSKCDVPAPVCQQEKGVATPAPVQKGKESAQCTTTTTTCDQAQKVEKVEKTVVHTGQIAEGSSSSSSSSSGEQEVNYGCACADLYDNCSQGSPDWTQQSLYTSPGQWGQLSNMKGFCKIDKCHDNFQTVGLHFGHSRSHGSKGAKIWNDTTFNNFSFQQVHAHSIDAHRANWSNFVFSDSNLNDWEWNDALLQTGYFSGNITDCKFTKATLKNVTFHNTNFKATKTIGKAGSTTFRHARFENVKFINGRLGRTSFANTIFMGNTYFENVSRFSFSRFENAIFVDADGRGHVLTPQIARRLDAAHQTQFTKGVRGRTISVSTNEIIQQIRQMSSL